MLITTFITAFTGISTEPPELLKTIAMLVFGMVIGCEVANGPRHRYLRLFSASAIFTLAVMSVAALLAIVLTQLVEQDFLVLFLSLAPGGIAEVSLVALALGLDAGLVALVHSCRFVYIITAGPLGVRWLFRRQTRPGHLD